MSEKYDGNDNYGRPKSEYIAALGEMSDAQLKSECYSMIYQSARCNNNPRADWHWMVDACNDEARGRGKGVAKIYADAYAECYRDHAG